LVLLLVILYGNQVNGLLRGQKYRYCYPVTFNKEAKNVRFGMVIKTITGLHLGGALTAPSLNETIPFIPAGKTINVEFTFNCYLNPNTYFMNAGVFGSNGQGETVLHRKADVSAFRVLPVNDNIATELIDFNFETVVM
jgi:lipopolysaccharide transport system ATP-binding protein